MGVNHYPNRWTSRINENMDRFLSYFLPPMVRFIYFFQMRFNFLSQQLGNRTQTCGSAIWAEFTCKRENLHTRTLLSA